MFIKYKDKEKVNLANVENIGKSSRAERSGSIFWQVYFLLLRDENFTNRDTCKIKHWEFDTEEERDFVYDMIMARYVDELPTLEQVEVMREIERLDRLEKYQNRNRDN